MHYNRSPKAEIIRCIQKDLTYTNELGADFYEVLQLTRPRTWIRYNNLCNLIAQITYHGLASLQNLQTLGEEYTGIFQIDNKQISIPSKLLRLTAIILESGGELLYKKILFELEKSVLTNNEILPEAKTKIKVTIDFMRNAIPFIKVAHKGLFYFFANNTKYLISKRVTGINYIHVRNWIRPDHSLYGYKLLGALTFLQLSITIALKWYNVFKEADDKNNLCNNFTSPIQIESTYRKSEAPKCTLCLESRKDTSLTPCGHVFCWKCILDWLDEKDECPLCRDKINKSNIIPLQNFS